MQCGAGNFGGVQGAPLRTLASRPRYFNSYCSKSVRYLVAKPVPFEAVYELSVNRKTHKTSEIHKGMLLGRNPAGFNCPEISERKGNGKAEIVPRTFQTYEGQIIKDKVKL